MVIGIATLLISNAATISTSFQPENSTKTGNVASINSTNASGGAGVKFGSVNSCGRVKSNYSYKVPFGNAVWNQPICNLPRYSRSAEFAQRFTKYTHYSEPANPYSYLDGDIAVSPGYPNPTFFDPDGLQNLFSREVYYASKATTQAQVQIIGGSESVPSNLDGTAWKPDENTAKMGYTSRNPISTIPWNPNWKTGLGGDNEIIILDDRPGETQGRIYTIWIYKPEYTYLTGKVTGSIIGVNRDRNGNYVDYRTFEGYTGDRGVGLSYYATLTTPEEVAAGEIRHALGITIPNTSYGPICTKQQFGTSAEHNTCGTAVAPASKFEWGGRSLADLNKPAPYNTFGIDKTIPEGMRFGLNMTYAQIDSWLASRTDLAGSANDRRRETARVFAYALKDYGMIVVDTGGALGGFQLVGGVNPDHGNLWRNLGIGPEYEQTTLLEGLVTANNLYVVEPPTVTCADNTPSKNYCDWKSATY